MASAVSADVPLIDFSQSEEAAAAAVHVACRDTGFFQVANHGIPASLVADYFDQLRRLFELPLEEKMALLADDNNRGYTPLHEETLDPERQTQGDTKEGFYFGREVPLDSEEGALPLHGPNQWPNPSTLPRFREVTMAYFEAVQALGFRLLRLLARGLSLPPDHFAPFFTQPMVFLRPLRYAPTASKPDDGIFGAGAHSDYGMLTILATDGVPGLQIHTATGWVDVPHVPGAFVINLGDMLERWTNGLYRSTLHRVVNHTGQERYSVPFFFEPNFTARVECLPCCCSGDRPAAYPPTTAGQHLLDKYAATHAGYTGPTKV